MLRYTVSGTRNRYSLSSQRNSHVKPSISIPPKTPMKVQEDSKAMVSGYSAAHTRDRTVGPSRVNTRVHGVRDTKPLQFVIAVQFSCQTEHLYPTQDPHEGAGRL